MSASALDNPSPLSRPRATRLELCLVFIALVAIAMIQIGASGTIRLLHHPMWLDETLTALIVNDTSFGHAMFALSRGVNHTPPTSYLLLWPMRWIFGEVGAVEMRGSCALAALLASVGVYGICRSLFDRAASFAGALALWTHPRIVDQAFEARFYTVWLAATAWLCYCLLRDSRERSKRHLIIACIMAAIVTTVHWFGIVSLLLIGAVDLFMYRSSPRAALLRRSIPIICGIVALLVCLPFLLKQRAALTESTWLEPTTTKQVRLVMYQLFCVAPISAALLCHWLWGVLGKRPIEQFRNLSVLAPISSLLLFPVVLLIVTYAFQPVMLARYAIVSALPLAVVAAWLAPPISTMCGRAWCGLLLVLLVVTGTVELQQHALATDATDMRIESGVRNAQAVINQHGPMPVVFLSSHEQYPAVSLHPELAEYTALLNFDVPLDIRMTASARFQVQMNRIITSVYPQYRLENYSRLQREKHFFIVAAPETSTDLPVFFPGAQIRPRSDDLFEVMMP